MKKRIVNSPDGKKYLVSKIIDSKLISEGPGTDLLPLGKGRIGYTEIKIWTEIYEETHVDENGKELKITYRKCTRNNKLYAEERSFDNQGLPYEFFENLENAETWGGYREGAGRKPTGRRNRGFYVTDEEYTILKEYLENIRNQPGD